MDPFCSFHDALIFIDSQRSSPHQTEILELCDVTRYFSCTAWALVPY